MADLLQKLLDAIKGLTFVNVAVLAALIVLLIPAYLMWRIMNDAALFNAVFSDYTELESPTDCQLTFQQASGGRGFYLIRLNLAQRSREIYAVSVRLDWPHAPDGEAIRRYCATLEALVAYGRDPLNVPIPHFPGSERNILPHAPPRGEHDDGRPHPYPMPEDPAHLEQMRGQ